MARYTEWPGGYQMDSSQDEDWEADEEDEDMARTRYEISIAYTDPKGSKRWVNNVGNLWFDGEKGQIVLPPGIALVGGENFYINVNLPRERGEGGQRQPQAGGGRGRGGYEGGDDDNLPF